MTARDPTLRELSPGSGRFIIGEVLLRKRLGVLIALAMVVAMLPTTATATEDGCRTTHTPIYEIQGDGDESPLHDFPQVVVTTEGIVTVDKQTADELSGFFIQSVRGDGNGATSDGIFVNARDEWDQTSMLATM